jgi:hypothetical protein
MYVVACDGGNQAMPCFYRIAKEHRLVLTTLFGVLSLADLLAYREKLLKDPDFDPAYSHIADFTQVGQVAMSAGEVEQFAQFDLFSTESRRALVAPTDEKYGLCRMFEMLREDRGETGVRVFRTLDEALDWVFPGGATR